MKPELPDDHITKKVVVATIPGMDAVTIKRDLQYSSGEEGALPMDVYYPPEFSDAETRPAVVTVSGYPDPGMERMLGSRFKEWGSSTSWGRLIAASGMVAVNYSNREPERDIHALLDHLRRNGEELGIDARRLGLLATSGHAPLGLSVLMTDRGETPLGCAAFICPLTLDLDSHTAVADAAKAYRFANPAASKTLDDLPAETPLFIARAGRDQTPGLNETLDRFVTRALARNLPLTLVNHPNAPHAFDVMDRGETSADIVRRILDFLRCHLEGLAPGRQQDS
jgi:acetyl esterase/lipase